ncbi:MAG: hypothetical protein FWD32_00350 [Firmicutes bacterium]|nr:hypothetical protein [Bacillota bacterium]
MANVTFPSVKFHRKLEKHKVAIKPATVPTNILPNGSNYQDRGYIVFGLEKDKRFSFNGSNDLVALVPVLGDILIKNISVKQMPYIKLNNDLYIETNRVGSKINVDTSSKTITWVSGLHMSKLITMPFKEYDILMKSGELCIGRLPNLFSFKNNDNKNESFNRQGMDVLQIIGREKIEESLELIETLEMKNSEVKKDRVHEFMTKHNCDEIGIRQIAQEVVGQSSLHKTIEKYIIEEKLHEKANATITTTKTTNGEATKNNNYSGT